MDDPVNHVDDGRYGPHLAGAHDDVGPGDDSGRVGGPSEERLGQTGLVHGVQVDEQVEHFRRTAHRITVRSGAGGLGPELGLKHYVELVVWLSPVDPGLAFVDQTLRIS